MAYDDKKLVIFLFLLLLTLFILLGCGCDENTPKGKCDNPFITGMIQ